MAALIISIIALVLSGVSLGWQVWSWRRSGAVVAVTALHSFPVYDHGVGDAHIDVTARNIGRAPVQVTGWGFALPSGDKLFVPRPAPWSAPLPHLLANGTSASWHVPAEEVQRACAERGIRHQDIRAFVRLGTGDTIGARRTGIGLK